MFSRDRWQEILESIANNKLRTFLSGFTISLGIFIFIVLFGMGNGLENSFQSLFLDDAINTIWIYPGNTSKAYKGYPVNRRIQFDNSDMEDLQRKFGNQLEYITPRINRSFLAKYRDKSNVYSVRSVAPAHQFNEKTIMMKGRYINQLDIDNQSKHAVIGRLVAQDLFDRRQSVLGEYIELGGSMYKVIGIFQDEGGDNEERMIYLPYTTTQMLENNNQRINQLILAYDKTLAYSSSLRLEGEVRRYLSMKHQTHPEDRNAIYIRNASSQLNQTQQFIAVIKMVVAFVGLGTLLAGMIGISNIMMFVVQERTKELGIRKALGASPSSVIGMVLQESTFITIISGYVGVLLGVLVLRSLGDSLEDYFILNPYVNVQTILLATLVLILSGLVAGYIPARRAARIRPIEALKD